MLFCVAGLRQKNTTTTNNIGTSSSISRRQHEHQQQHQQQRPCCAAWYRRQRRGTPPLDEMPSGAKCIGSDAPVRERLPRAVDYGAQRLKDRDGENQREIQRPAVVPILQAFDESPDASDHMARAEGHDVDYPQHPAGNSRDRKPFDSFHSRPDQGRSAR